MSKQKGASMTFNVPNLLSLFRIAAAPFLLLAAWFEMAPLFFLLFGLMLLSDGLDGYIARKWHLTSKLGAKLDSIGDIVTYLSTPLAIWWLWPGIIKEEAIYIAAVIALYISPAFFSLAKFGELASYHTWIAKASAVLMSAGVVLLVGFKDPTLFHIAVAFLVVEAAENIAITLLLPEPGYNIRSFWHALKSRRTGK
jgi:CDP-diacylglycerol--glycerol-3-phosphate 3-phosphatidyltransferase